MFAPHSTAPTRRTLARRTALRCATWLGVLSLAPSAQIQDEVRAGGAQARLVETEAQELLQQSSGLGHYDGTLVAGGPDYRARFEAGSVTFTPALGERAPTTMTFTWALDEITRDGASVLQADGTAVPRREGDEVVYVHAGGIEERYEVTAEGLWQSFLFPTRPAGSGDLVVRGTVATELAAVAARQAGEGPLFELPGVGGVRFGTVTGVDANGATVAGDVRLVGGALELVLPAAFVDGAAYPLLLDPLIGAEIDVSGGFYDDGRPDVAYDTTNQTFLVVWERTFGINDVDVRAQRVDRFGNLVGGTIFVSFGSSIIAIRPAVASVNQTNQFLLVWQQAANALTKPQIAAKSIDAASGALSGLTILAPSDNVQLMPDVGGDRATVEDDCIVVWDETGVGIRGAQVTARSDQAPYVVNQVVTLKADDAQYAHTEPAISESGGDPGYLLVTWTRIDQGGDGDIEGRIVNRNLILFSQPQRLAESGPGADDVAADVDGDGQYFVVAWERVEPLNASSSDIFARSFEWDGQFLVPMSPEVGIEIGVDDDEFAPAVSWTGSRALVAFLDVDSTANTYAKLLDPFTCMECVEEMQLSGSPNEELRVGVASQYSGGGTGDDVLVAYESFDSTTSSSQVFAQRFDDEDDSVSVIDGCGFSGTQYVPCARAGSSAMTVQLRDAAPLAPVVLVASTQGSSFTCGPCVLVPQIDAGTVYIGAATDSNGNASVSGPLPPSLQGQDLYSQWLVRTPGGCNLFVQYGLSNALRTPIY